MAGAFVQISYDARQAIYAFDQLDRFGSRPLVEAGEDIGNYLLFSTQERAALERSPEGVPWLPLTPAYAVRKAEKRPAAKILVYDFHLLGDLLAYANDGEDLVFGTGALWGATHQFGRGAIPPRPWLGLTEADGAEIELIVADRMAAIIAEAGADGPA